MTQRKPWALGKECKPERVTIKSHGKMAMNVPQHQSSGWLVQRSVLEICTPGEWPRDMPVTRTEEDKIGITADLIISVIAQGIDTTLGAWLTGTVFCQQQHGNGNHNVCQHCQKNVNTTKCMVFCFRNGCCLESKASALCNGFGSSHLVTPKWGNPCQHIAKLVGAWFVTRQQLFHLWDCLAHQARHWRHKHFGPMDTKMLSCAKHSKMTWGWHKTVDEELWMHLWQWAHGDNSPAAFCHNEFLCCDQSTAAWSLDSWLHFHVDEDQCVVHAMSIGCAVNEHLSHNHTPEQSHGFVLFFFCNVFVCQCSLTWHQLLGSLNFLWSIEDVHQHWLCVPANSPDLEVKSLSKEMNTNLWEEFALLKIFPVALLAKTWTKLQTKMWCFN